MTGKETVWCQELCSCGKQCAGEEGHPRKHLCWNCSNEVKKRVCPKCGSDSYMKQGFTDKRKQRYKCKNKKCGRSFIDTKNHIKTGHSCPCCKSTETIRYGRTLLTGGYERQRIKCKDCDHVFYLPKRKMNKETKE